MQYRSVTVLAPAKLNLSLDVVGTLPNGYHDLDMVMQTIDLYEKITLRRSNDLSLTLPGSFVPVNDKNTAVKAALAFFDYTGLLAGVDMTIYKRVPVRAGMAGGSSDGAAVLRILRREYYPELPQEKLAQIAKARQARATAKLDAAKQKEEALRRKNLERRAERMEKIWAKRRAKTGKAILKGKLPASALDSLVADSLREARAFAALDSLFRDSLAADSLGRDSMQLDSLKAGVAAADSLRGDSIAAPAGDSLYRLVKGYRRVKIFRNDFQAVCDSLVAVSTDSMILLYIDPVLWNQDNQITSDVMKIYTENSKLQKAEFVGRPVMSSEIDTMTYNQVTGKLITAYFRNNKIYRNDVDGNVQTIYYMQEDDSPEPVGLVSIQSGAATYYIDNNTVEGITYRNQPVFSIFPMDKIPETQALFLEDFKWEGHRRPALREVFDRTIRPSERAEKSALPRPDFPITRRIEEYKKLLIESGTWVDRDDKLTPEALEWLHWLGY